MSRTYTTYKAKFEKYGYVLVVLFAVLSWLPVIGVRFINDDYQILGYHAGKSWISLLQPFWSPDISNFYWRPLGNVIHPLIIHLAGFNPVVFRIVSVVIYSACCLVIMKGGEKIGLSRSLAILGAMLFAVLPSHELQVAWIADQGEAIVTIFILLAFFSYSKYSRSNDSGFRQMVTYLIWILAAVLVKESAFTAALIPLCYMVLKGDYSKTALIRYSKDILAGVLIIAIVLIYRWLIIGGTPFSSNHFSHGGPVRWIANFFIYIPLAIVPPETLEFLTVKAHNPLLAVLFFIILSAIIIIIIGVFKKTELSSRRKIAAAGVWFLIFVLPGLPTLMRWYVFTASIGLLWMFFILIDGVQAESYFRKISLWGIIAVILGVSAYDFLLMKRWESAGEKMETALTSLSMKENSIKSDSLYVWAIPDKVRRIPLMKLGIQETIQWGLNNKNITVITPLRAEMNCITSKISLVEKSDTSLIFHLNGGRFLMQGGESKSIIGDERITKTEDGLEYRIRTFIDKNNVPQSIAGIRFLKSMRKDQLFYDGSGFTEVR